MSAPAPSTPPAVPRRSDPVAEPFWEAAREHRLVMQRCGACGALRWTPRRACPECLEPGGEWVDVDGRGTVWSFAVYHRAFHPAFADQLPYNVALVQLDAGPMMITNVVDADSDLAIGQRVHAVFHDVTPEVTLVKFAPEPGS